MVWTHEPPPGGDAEEASTPHPQAPLGGALVDRVLTGDALVAARERAATLPSLMIDVDAAITAEIDRHRRVLTSCRRSLP